MNTLNKIACILSIAVGLPAILFSPAHAQTSGAAPAGPITVTNVVTTTNVVIVMVTNIVTVTNVVPNPEVVVRTGPAASHLFMLPPRYPWENSIALGATLTEGNSDSVLATGSFRTHRKTPANEYLFGVDGAYGESESVENNETLHGIGQYNHLFNERYYGYLNGEGLHDGIADLQYRFTFGPGLGYYLIKETNTTLAVESGPSVIYQQLGGEDSTYASWRLAERFEQRLRNNARFWEKAEILPQVNKLENFIVNAEIGAEASFTKTLSLRLTVVDNFVNEPAADRRKNDVKIISGLVYKF